MQSPISIAVALTLACTATATLKPAYSNSKGKRPKHTCQEAKRSKDIQAAECSHNVRTHELQTFAVFIKDPSKDKYHGAPYGDCYAYTCEPPTEMIEDERAWLFLWSNLGDDKEGPGTGCIKDSQTGKCGCENSNGQFIPEGNNCK
ncbi:hypothetical protein EJ03DRAFT_122423 [Teratosphaeria nubilosa]|uniref:Small secreted protein n=1 Tax=Teratosphaeria nubilosa TaxID=161662 RepID=A0A6G1L6X6_9PEZI|nr:hypothetical protein EJ03DRAFT_122423 [Teratosphaeria nubilosa]